ncbi:PLP-dependent aminotransferase family protein [Streptococcus macacae]|uniref:Bacterial regulatory protein, GntR family n=1 Tax=Streptococcus macacae NCTC 11558 TaxID=764298 RepID=G5JUU3_9STRE|nr:PLP-dependent aminotransferase family protein [Streptococcus macacae]EHJ52128.1 bacterial regulatory protein, GntR family [Streptococcus macacae NCTC 11558]SUN78908.1 GntR family transcriptional regulator [Streptococcus macacae NCTC 11558]
MPVNSFDNYPMTWKPDKQLLTPFLYASLAELLEKDIIEGRLIAETKLPPQRELADFLDINLSTVTRAFKLCEQKGLIYAIIGKGTFVSPNRVKPLAALQKNEPLIPLGNLRPYYQLNYIVSDISRRILQSQSVDKLFEFDRKNDLNEHKAVAQQWLKKFQVDTSKENIFLTEGTQNALVLLFLTVFKAGDKIATDMFTYTNFIALAQQFKIELIPILSDHNGIIPEDLEKKCRQQMIKGIYLVPTSNNPTGATMLLERRQQLSSLINKNHLLLIEDDTYAFTNYEKLPALVTMIPKQTIYIHGLSKALFAGLRVAYMVVPDYLIHEINLTADVINTHPLLLNTKITSHLISSGQANSTITQKNQLSQQRNALYNHYFPETTSTNSYSLFQWLPLPKNRSGYQFESLAKEKGVEVLCAERFLVGGLTEQSALRIATCSPNTLDELDRGLKILKSLVEK